MFLKVTIRADASSDIGTGHIVRCLTLADELRRRGARVEFICREAIGNMIDQIDQATYKVHRLPAHNDLETDRRLTQRILESQLELPDWLVIDHYDIDISWESYLRRFTKRIMVIDDLTNREHDCDLLLDQNLYGDFETRYVGLVPHYCRKLLGPKYALLRPQFYEERKRHPKRDGRIKRILVSMGGTDPTNETCKALRALQMLNRSDIATDLIIGTANPHRSEIAKLASQMPKVTCHFQVKDMAGLMSVADVSIGAGGTTTWERCCMGLPAIIITMAENQKELAETLGKQGLIINLGWHTEVKELDLKNALEVLLSNSEAVAFMSRRARKVVDGRGAERVVIKMAQLHARQ